MYLLLNVISIVFLQLIQHKCEALVLASSRLEVCEAGPSQPSSTKGEETCKKKLVMSFSIGPGQENPEVIEINRFIDGDKEEPLGQRFRIFPSRTRVFTVYPLIHVGAANSRPFENWFKVRRSRTEIALFSDPCSDSEASSNPSCGYFRNGGERIRGSQGFCCRCSSSDLVGLGGRNSAFRGNLNCKIFSPHYSSAHCLRFNRNWYNAWELGRAQIFHEIRIAIYQETDTNGTIPEPSKSCQNANAQPTRRVDMRAFYCLEVLTIGVQRKVDRSEDGTVIATFVGDFSPSVLPHEMSSRLLFTPTSQRFTNTSDPMYPYRYRATHWLIVDKTDVDLTGHTCNKIGVNHPAFRDHGRSIGCGTSTGSCLRNQPWHLVESDLARIEEGEQPRYFASRFGSIQIGREEGQYLLKFVLDTNQDSLYTLEIAADDARIFVRDLQYSVVEIGVFGLASMSRDLILWVELSRQEIRVGTVYISVECSEFVAPVPSVSFPFNSENMLSRDLVFVALRTLSNKALTHACHVSLRNIRGRMTDSAEVAFRTTATCACLGLCQCECVDEQPVMCFDDDEPLSRGNPNRGDDDDMFGLSRIRGFFDRLLSRIGLSWPGVWSILGGLAGLAGLAVCIKLGILPLILKLLFSSCCHLFCSLGGLFSMSDGESNWGTRSGGNNGQRKGRRKHAKSNNRSKPKATKTRGGKSGKTRDSKEKGEAKDTRDKTDKRGKRNRREKIEKGVKINRRRRRPDERKERIKRRNKKAGRKPYRYNSTSDSDESYKYERTNDLDKDEQKLKRTKRKRWHSSSIEESETENSSQEYHRKYDDEAYHRHKRENNQSSRKTKRQHSYEATSDDYSVSDKAITEYMTSDATGKDIFSESETEIYSSSFESQSSLKRQRLAYQEKTDDQKSRRHKLYNYDSDNCKDTISEQHKTNLEVGREKSVNNVTAAEVASIEATKNVSLPSTKSLHLTRLTRNLQNNADPKRLSQRRRYGRSKRLKQRHRRSLKQKQVKRSPLPENNPVEGLFSLDEIIIGEQSSL
eukprot:gene1840-4938_t